MSMSIGESDIRGHMEGFEIARLAGGRIAELWALNGPILNGPLGEVAVPPSRPGAQAGKASAEENRRIYQGLTDAWDRGEVDRWPDFLAPNFVSHEPGREDWNRKTWLQVAVGGYAHRTHWKSTLLQVVSEGDMLACHYAVEATGTGRGTNRAGRRGRREGFEIVRIAGGRIAESWNLWGPPELLPEAPSPAAGG